MSEQNSKKYGSGAEKLEAEQEQCLASVAPAYKEMARKQYDLVFAALIQKCKEDTEFDLLVNQEHKSWGRCMKYVSDQAMKLCNPTDEEKAKARSGQQPIAAPVSSDVLFKWIDEYYRKDDKADVEKEEQKKASEKKRKTEPKKGKEQSAKRETDAAKQEKDVTRKKDDTKKAAPQKKKMENQLSIFDLMGV